MSPFGQKSVAVIGVLIVAAFAGGVYLLRPVLYGGIESLSGSISALIAGVFSGSETFQHNQFLVVENADLRARVALLEAGARENEELRELLEMQKQAGFEYRTADRIADPRVSFSDSLALGAGERDGIRAGQPVVWGSSIFLGLIHEVHDRYSVASTLFERNVSMPVVVGSGKATALLTGGTDITLDLIPIDAGIAVGDPVFTAPGYGEVPPGLFVGEIMEITRSEGEVFQRAVVRVPYRLYAIMRVSVITGSR